MQLFLLLCQDFKRSETERERSEQQRLRLEEENRHHRQEKHWRRRLLANRELSSSHKIVLLGIEPELSASGLKQVNLARVSGHIGLSPKTTGRCTKQLAEAGALQRQEERELKDDGSVRTHVLLAPTERTARPDLITLPTPRNHGGKRICHHCGSENLVEQVTVTCQSCGAVLHRKCKPLNPPADNLTVGQEERTPEQPFPSPDETGPSEPSIGEGCHETTTAPPMDILSPGDEEVLDEAPLSPKDNLSLVLEPGFLADNLSPGDKKPATPPTAPVVLPLAGADQGDQKPATLPSVALVLDEDALVALLMHVAGDASQHVVMNDGSDPSFDGKYRTVHRPLRETDIRAHLAGKRTIGATLSHQDGTTRALCSDTDTPEGLTLLHEAARSLTEAGYRPLIEISPADRGGHLWVIFDGPVSPDAAYHRLCEIAPNLRDIKEHWPVNNRKVRLLAGRYVTPSFKAPCPLLDPQGQEIPPQSLLTLQTPASLVPDHPFRHSLHDMNEQTKERTHARMKLEWGEMKEPPATSEAGPDAYWQRKYGGHQPFAWTHRQLVELFNQHISVRDLLPVERGGKALATWEGGERTPSVAFTLDGKGWVDFRARSIRSDGTPDGGDAFELAVRLSGRSKAEVMADFSRCLRREWLALLDGAAARGEAVPERMVPYMTPEGWERYERKRQGGEDHWFADR